MEHPCHNTQASRQRLVRCLAGGRAQRQGASIAGGAGEPARGFLSVSLPIAAGDEVQFSANAKERLAKGRLIEYIAGGSAKLTGGAPGLQIRCRVVKAVLGGFDSHALP